jgi:hypothetical protein
VERAEREAWTGGGDAKPSLRRKWQAALVPSLFFFCKITASVAILPSAFLNEPFGLYASWAFSFQWVLSICISTSISPDSQGVGSRS